METMRGGKRTASSTARCPPRSETARCFLGSGFVVIALPQRVTPNANCRLQLTKAIPPVRHAQENTVRARSEDFPRDLERDQMVQSVQKQQRAL